LRSRPLFPALQRVGETWAPAAVSEQMPKRTMGISGDMNVGIQLSIMAPLCQLETASAGTSGDPGGFLCGGWSSSTSTTSQSLSNLSQLSLNPMLMQGVYQNGGATNALYAALPDNVFLSNLASNFSRYRVKKLAFHYEPQSTSSEVARYAFAYSQDPCQRYIGIPAGPVAQYAAAVPLADTSLDSTPNSVFFAPWQSWSMDCPVDELQCHYMWYPRNYGTLSSSVYVDSAQMRMGNHGLIACICSGATGGLQTGRLFIEAVYDFFDPVPQNILSSGASRLGSQLERPMPRPPLATSESKEQKIDDEDVPDCRSVTSKGIKVIAVDDEPSPLALVKVPPISKSSLKGKGTTS
jgi:hypothetical protein